MSTSTGIQTNVSPSTGNFTSIFNSAINEYKRLTKQDLLTHPFAAEFDACNSPDLILVVFRKQAQAFDKFREGDEKLMEWLNPTVHVLFTLLVNLAEGIGLPFLPAKTIFTGISVLLGAVRDLVTSYGTLVNLFERIQLFLQRLNCYTNSPLTIEMTELLGKIMAQILSILAFSTQAMKEKWNKKIVNRLMGRRDIEDGLLRLDTLTKEEGLMVAARTLERTDEIKRNQSREKLQTWLSPPNPSINHNIAYNSHHRGTATWFIQGITFQEWKKNGSLLWIHGNPGCGKSVLCAAVIENIRHMAKDKSTIFAYYYFDFQDTAKRDLRGLLSSLLMQLSECSVSCWDVLCQLYSTCRDGSEQPSEAALAGCLRNMLACAGHVPLYIVIDALDECPITAGTPSPRRRVLDFLEDLVGRKYPNLHICITSRPEQDIQATLNPLTSPSCRLSLHDEIGQIEDIHNYIRFFVYSDEAMRRWSAEDQDLVINTLSERAGGMFRWVHCQLDTLCRCFPPSIRAALNELPTTLDDTYERTLQGIPKEKWQHAHRLLQCLVAAIRPLRVRELAEIFTIEFDPDAGLDLVEKWRPENPEEAILSACSTLITVIDEQDTKIVQFSHFTVKEFLISDRLRNSLSGKVSHHYIPLNSAHMLLARACLTVLLQLHENVDEELLARFPLARYAAQYWVEHVQFENIASGLQDAIQCLFHPGRAHFRIWTTIHDVSRRSKSLEYHFLGRSPPSRTPLYYAAFCGFTELAEYLIVTHNEDVNAKGGLYGTPLHAASFKGRLDAARLLLDYGADVNSTKGGEIPLRLAYKCQHFEVMKLLLSRGAKVDLRDEDYIGTVLHRASWDGEAEAVELLLQHGADVHARSPVNLTPLDLADANGHSEIAQLLLGYGTPSFAVGPLVGSASQVWFAPSFQVAGDPSDRVNWTARPPHRSHHLPFRSRGGPVPVQSREYHVLGGGSVWSATMALMAYDAYDPEPLFRSDDTGTSDSDETFDLIPDIFLMTPNPS